MFEHTIVGEFAGRRVASRADVRPECSDRKARPGLAGIQET
ncbi:MAG: hypothetical protein ACLFNW_02860 [Desulfobacterales bacterium]